MPETAAPPVLTAPAPRPSAILGKLGLSLSAIALGAFAVLVLAKPG